MFGSGHQGAKVHARKGPLEVCPCPRFLPRFCVQPSGLQIATFGLLGRLGEILKEQLGIFVHSIWWFVGAIQDMLGCLTNAKKIEIRH